MSQKLIKIFTLPLIPDEIWDIIFRQASYVEGEEATFEMTNEPPFGQLYNDYGAPYNDWRSAVQTRANIALVCRRWHRIGTPILYSSYQSRRRDPFKQQDFISICHENSQRFASHIRSLRAHHADDSLKNFVLVCSKLRQLAFSGFFMPTHLLSALSKGVRHLSLNIGVEEAEKFAKSITQFHSLESLGLTVHSDLVRRSNSSTIVKISLPNTRNFRLKYYIWEDLQLQLPISFSCPQLQNLEVYRALDVSSNAHLIADTSELSSLSIDYATLAAIEKKNPGTLLNSHLQRICLFLSPSDPLFDTSLFSAAENMCIFALDGTEAGPIGNIERIFAFLSDKASTPKLSSVYFDSISDWNEFDGSLIKYFIDLLASLQERGVRFFAEVDTPEYIEIKSQDTILQLFDRSSALYQEP